jgi:hypothetical protein
MEAILSEIDLGTVALYTISLRWQHLGNSLRAAFLLDPQRKILEEE